MARRWALAPLFAAALSSQVVDPASARGYPEKLDISNVQGPYAEWINQRYYLDTFCGGIQTHGYSCYSAEKKGFARDPDETLNINFNWELGKWVLQRRSELGSKKVLMMGMSKDAPFATQAGPWMAINANFDLVVDNNVLVQALPNLGSSRLKGVSSTMLIGALFLFALALAFFQSPDGRLRRQTYWLIGATLAFTAAGLLAQAFLDLNSHILETIGLMPRGYAAMCTAFTAFLGAYAMLTYVGWKLQTGEPRLVAVGGLGAPIAGLLGVVAFEMLKTKVQDNLVEDLLAIDSTFPVENARLIAGIVAVGLFWVALALCHWIFLGQRKTAFLVPPVKPWSQGKKKASGSGSPSSRTCIPTGCGTTPPPADEGTPWSLVVTDAEDQVTAIIVGWTLFNVLKDFAHEAELDGYLNLFTIFGIYFLVAVVAFLLARSTKEMRVFVLLTQVFFVAAMWSLAYFRVMNPWTLTTWMDDSPSRFAANAYAATTFCLLGLFVAVKLLQSASSASVDQVMCRVNSGLGLATGLCWAATLYSGLANLMKEAIVPTNPTVADREDARKARLMFQALAAVLFTALLARVYLVGTMPKAAQSEASYGKSILREMTQKGRTAVEGLGKAPGVK